MVVEYLLFLAKTVTIVIAIALLLLFSFSLSLKGKKKGKLKVKSINAEFKGMCCRLQDAVLPKKHLKALRKSEKKEEKKEVQNTKRRIFVIDFQGDIKASAVSELRNAITALLTIATSKDEVVVRMDSAGGQVHAYGLGASQLQRIRDKRIPLTVSIDKIAASGGYMMACVADHVVAAPFAIIGSIGVVAQIPNFNRLLSKNNIDIEQITAGEYKRTLTLFGKNTEKGRKKVQQELDLTHELFKKFITEHRAGLDINKVATGEHWYGTEAVKLKLVDTISTSDDYLFNESQRADIYQVSYETKKSILQKVSDKSQQAIGQLFYAGPHF